jgi:hypothetical protein
MTDQTPAETLRAAAQGLREAAHSAIPGPWAADPDELGRGYDVWQIDGPHLAFGLRRPDAEWIALTHPGLAEPLAAWLEMEAHMWDLRGNSAEGNTFHALAVARVVLGRDA